MLWTAQELIQLVKDDMGLRDLPPTVTDQELLDRFTNSCLKEFSLIYPRLETFNMGRDDLLDPPNAYYSHSGGIRYRIPKYITAQNMEILSVLKIEPLRINGFSDCLWPGIGFSPYDVMTSVTSIQAAAAVGQNVVNSLTWAYDSLKNIIVLYHGWSTISYRVRISVAHDPSLSTVPPTAMSTLRELATYDLGQYIYNTMKRKNNVDTGVGTITLNIDDFADYGSKKRDLLEKLSEDANLDVDELEYF